MALGRLLLLILILLLKGSLFKRNNTVYHRHQTKTEKNWTVWSRGYCIIWKVSHGQGPLVSYTETSKVLFWRWRFRLQSEGWSSDSGLHKWESMQILDLGGWKLVKPGLSSIHAQTPLWFSEICISLAGVSWLVSHISCLFTVASAFLINATTSIYLFIYFKWNWAILLESLLNKMSFLCSLRCWLLLLTLRETKKMIQINLEAVSHS